MQQLMPSMQQQQQQQPQPQPQQLQPQLLQQQQAASEGVGGSLAEVASIFTNLVSRMEARADEGREQTKADRAEMEAKLEQQRSQMEAEMERLKTELTTPPPAAITQGEITALQARVESLHAAKLLTDEELWAAGEETAPDKNYQLLHSPDKTTN